VNNQDKPIIVDLFCGCGGFGLGAELAGFHTVAAVDIDETLQSAYKRNFPNTKVINSDLSKMGGEDWNNLLGDTEIDGVIGGPPCQGYSRMGAGDEADPRRQLLMDFFRHVNILSPKFFVMENVEGLMDEKNIGQLNLAISLVDKKYTVLKPIIVDASLYGAPTKRKRVVVIGYDAKRLGDLAPADFLSTAKEVTVRDAIADISEPIKQSKDKDNYGWTSYRTNKNLSAYAKMMRKLPPKGLGWSEAISYLKQDKLSGHFDTTHTESVRQRYETVQQGSVDSVSRSKKLAWNGLCPTLRAGTGPDKGSHQAVRPIHPSKGRVITVREAARLQGFPDWFCFHPTKWHSFRMIGNSVSPIVSKAILSKIQDLLNYQKIDMTG
jgi:DNA (cytosine-5)-methyltransferase 1